MAKRKSRSFLTIAALLVTAAALTYAFWPRPLMVDMDVAKRGAMIQTINEEGRTRVHDAYVVSSPVAGRLMRVEAKPGDAVIRNETVVAQMRPLNPAALDIRTREQARAAVTAAEAALRVARADLNKAIADLEFADSEWQRSKQLAAKGSESQAALDRKQSMVRSASAIRDTAEAAIAMREAELANTRARLISFDDPQPTSAQADDHAIPLKAPTTGHILRVIQQSETTLTAGTPIMEIGNIENDLEVVVELLSTDAVQVSPGDRVIIEDWGGEATLSGEVERVDPWGFKKFSSLGVEEQRVNAVIQFTGPRDTRLRLGHGYRVEVRIVIWESDGSLIIPSNALFRDGEDWAVFKVIDGKAQQARVNIGRNNGIKAQILDGLKEGDPIILYPSAGITNGVKVAQRTME
ncbi:HlyD family efflux transporter periplasmic adaptor subunit [Cohaesibacter sp. CAU 1516]|uniref:efflux RND transporter periplasmic adaptor subunit n=1 Tax=Cohaesibacter sp. CAU 1516 TaxID=2576038 RepID=UPI0010FE49DD|nr:HlyD family efflux transporter periplasmic adaptor subunit [Cohaesibacter sp. CAU 1516]TLP48367.1 HlyD family efflux transporter periplasmic adaptor subunit [Cohaesibacter sp. CAU 1516]